MEILNSSQTTRKTACLEYQGAVFICVYHLQLWSNSQLNIHLFEQTHGTNFNSWNPSELPFKTGKKNESMQWSKTYCIKKQIQPSLSSKYIIVFLYTNKKITIFWGFRPQEKNNPSKKTLKQNRVPRFFVFSFFFFSGAGYILCHEAGMEGPEVILMASGSEVWGG